MGKWQLFIFINIDTRLIELLQFLYAFSYSSLLALMVQFTYSLILHSKVLENLIHTQAHNTCDLSPFVDESSIYSRLFTMWLIDGH